MVTESALPEVVDFWRNHAYDGWLAKQDVPVHTGYYIEDARTLERGWWSLRGCPAAIISLEGHRGIEHVHVLEIPPGETLPPFRMALEEVIYVFEGNGIANVWAEGQPKITFEWQKHSLFRIPVNYSYEGRRGQERTPPPTRNALSPSRSNTPGSGRSSRRSWPYADSPP